MSALAIVLFSVKDANWFLPTEVQAFVNLSALAYS